MVWADGRGGKGAIFGARISPGGDVLDPVGAVKPELQGQGIGQALVEDGLEALRNLGAQGCVLLGEPEFYGRFGFRSSKDLELEGARREYFLSLAFGEASATGKVTYHEAFRATC